MNVIWLMRPCMQLRKSVASVDPLSSCLSPPPPYTRTHHTCTVSSRVSMESCMPHSVPPLVVPVKLRRSQVSHCRFYIIQFNVQFIHMYIYLHPSAFDSHHQLLLKNHILYPSPLYAHTIHTHASCRVCVESSMPHSVPPLAVLLQLRRSQVSHSFGVNVYRFLHVRLV